MPISTSLGFNTLLLTLPSSHLTGGKWTGLLSLLSKLSCCCSCFLFLEFLVAYKLKEWCFILTLVWPNPPEELSRWRTNWAGVVSMVVVDSTTPVHVSWRLLLQELIKTAPRGARHQMPAGGRWIRQCGGLEGGGEDQGLMRLHGTVRTCASDWADARWRCTITAAGAYPRVKRQTSPYLEVTSSLQNSHHIPKIDRTGMLIAIYSHVQYKSIAWISWGQVLSQK